MVFTQPDRITETKLVHPFIHGLDRLFNVQFKIQLLLGPIYQNVTT